MDLHDHSQLRDARRVNDSLSFCPDYPMEPSLSHLVRLLLSDIVMILGWSYLRCIDSHIIILVEYRSDLLYIPMELFSSHWDGLDALVAILWHISLFWLWRWLFSQILVTVFITWTRDISLHYWSQFLWFWPRWAFNEARHSSFDCPTIHDSLVDCCVEIMVVTLADYSLETPHWVISLRRGWISPIEHVELEASDLLWHIIKSRDSVRWAVRPYL